MTSLPPTAPARYINNLHINSVYKICTTLEKSLQQSGNRDNFKKNLIYIRILGYLIHYVPTDEGLFYIKAEILSCPDDQKILDVGKRYYDHYVRASNKGPIPIPSNHVSRPSFDTIADMINDTLVEAPQSHSAAKKNALIRDGFRCVITGEYNARSVSANQELRERARMDPTSSVGPTQCAHIFSESTNSNIEPESAKRDYAASMWAVMKCFGYSSLPDELNGSKVHRLENVMTLALKFHELFDDLKIWFVETAVENRYKIEAADELMIRNHPQYVTFTTPDPEKLPVPSPKYLRIHAACARVAHLSGAAEFIDKFYSDMDDSTTLDPDGGSAMMLEHAIFELEARGYETTA